MQKKLSLMFSEYVSQLEFKDLPDDVVQKTKLYVLDLIGVALAGSNTKEGKIAAEFAISHGGRREAVVLARDERVPSYNAAFANGIMAHALDFDDSHDILHVGSSVIPAALAVAEKVDASGKDFLTAVVAGYEVAARIGLAVSPWHRKRGYHPTGTCNCFGTAAAGAKLLGLNEVEMAHSFGIAGTQASGLCEFHSEGSMIKPFHAGRAAQSGVISALLAKDGYTGDHTILEGRFGFFRVLSDKYDETRCENLGKEFEIVKTAIKPYPCCVHIHGPIECALKLMREHKIRADEIENVRVETYEHASFLTDKPDFPTVLEARLSLQYGVAVAFTRGDVTLKHYTPEKIEDPEIRNFAKRVDVVVDDELSRVYPQKWPSVMVLALKDGTKLRCGVDYPKGRYENPLTKDELAAKFVDTASIALKAENVTKVLSTVETTERLDTVKTLSGLLRCNAVQK